MQHRGRNYTSILFITYLPLVFIAKIIRYTVLKKSTVDTGIGHYFIDPILHGTNSFYIIGLNSISSSDQGSAADNAIWIFRFFNWFNLITYEQFEVAITIIFNIFLFLILKDFCQRNKFLSFRQYLFFALFIGVCNIYTFVLSKEPIQMLYFLIMYLVLRSSWNISKKWIGCLATILLIIMTTRAYYVLMGMFSIAFFILYPRINKLLRGKFIITFIIFFIIFGGIFDAFLHFAQVSSPDNYEELIRVRMRGTDDVAAESATVIAPWIPFVNLETFSLNYVITAVRMLFPIELLRLGPKYVPFIIFQLTISLLFLKELSNYKNITSMKKLIVCLYWGFFFCSASFEPDFGSWVRHESVTIPFVIFILDNENVIYDKKLRKVNLREYYRKQ